MLRYLILIFVQDDESEKETESTREFEPKQVW